MKFKKIFWILIYILALFFLFYYLYKYFNNIRSIITIRVLWYFLIALILNCISFALAGFAWAYMLGRHHKKIDYFSLLKTFYISQITRYIPGNIWSYLARVKNSNQLGVSKSACTYFYAIENINLIFVSFLFSLLSINLLKTGSYTSIFVISSVLLIFLVIIYFKPSILKKALNVFARKFKTKMEYNDLNKFELFIVFLLYALYWIFFGLSFYVIFIAIGGNKLPILTAIGVNAAAWLIGYLSFLTPSGLGVREGAFVVLLLGYANTVLSLAMAIASRLIFTLAEVLDLLIILGISIVVKGK